jgi:hypothetical protein
MTNMSAEQFAALDPETRAALNPLLEMIRRQREHYGLPPEPLTTPTFEEIRAWETQATIDLINNITQAHGGEANLTDPMRIWLESTIHNRHLADFAYYTITADCWDPDEEPGLVHNAWGLPEWPAQIGLPKWREMFERVGFWCNDDDCEVHAEEDVASGTLTVWRGSFSSHKRGLSWTLDRDRAAWFTQRGDMTGKGRRMRLWRCEVPAERQYAHLTNRSEDEVVADVRGLKIEAEG